MVFAVSAGNRFSGPPKRKKASHRGVAAPRRLALSSFGGSNVRFPALPSELRQRNCGSDSHGSGRWGVQSQNISSTAVSQQGALRRSWLTPSAPPLVSDSCGFLALQLLFD